MSLSKATPIMVSYFFISVAFGVISSKYLGYNAILMSLSVFAGASQFIAIKMLENKAEVALIILITFLINSRHFLMSGYMSKFFESEKWYKKMLIAFGITDETFAVGSLNPLNWESQFKLNTFSLLAWVSGTAFGILFGKIIPQSLNSVLPFGLTAMFISILNSNLKGKSYIIAALSSGIIAFMLKNEFSIIIASIVGIIAGGVSEKWME